jgi:hypothetical protein
MHSFKKAGLALAAVAALALPSGVAILVAASLAAGVAALLWRPQ